MSRILMVDDAELFRLLDTSFVRRLGCDIVRARDAGDVLARAGASAPDLIVIDAGESGTGAADCIRALKADATLRGTPVVVVASSSTIKDCSEAGADAALARPLPPGALEMTLGSLGGLAWRREPRRTTRMPARLVAGATAGRALVKDISRSGVFLALTPPLTRDSELRLSLRLPAVKGPRAVAARGVVVRTVEDDPESHLIPGVGVRFVDLDRAAASCIDHYVRFDTGPQGAAGANAVLRDE